jgi:hypothetical protein
MLAILDLTRYTKNNLTLGIALEDVRELLWQVLSTRYEL